MYLWIIIITTTTKTKNNLKKIIIEFIAKYDKKKYTKNSFVCFSIFANALLSYRGVEATNLLITN